MSRSTFATAAVVDGKNIDVANLETIHLVPLAAQDPTETKKLLEAAKYPGFFYLDLQGDAPPPQVVTDIPKVYNSSKKYFGQHHDLKMKDYREDQEPGYKKSDCDETFEVMRPPQSFRSHKYVLAQ
ncbi:MAG: hypothetical protein M1840_001769 [Geoglossum simile]|nr:MAG: hypothetical protein M1840_001769 [Geoglossum simile]